MGEMTVSDTRHASVGIFLLAMSVLMIEVTLTRVFSVMSWHHFAYLIISLAFLGFGAASSFLTVSDRFFAGGFNKQLLAKYALAFCLSSAFGFAAATKVRFYPLDVYFFGDYSNAFSLLMLYVIVGTPFFFAGVCIGYLIAQAGDAINRLYFADLLGAGTGTLLSIVGINHLGAEATIYAAAAAGGIVAILFAVAGSRRLFIIGAGAALCLTALMAVAAAHREIFPVYFPPEKLFRQAMTPHYYRWHVVARIDIMEPEAFSSAIGGMPTPEERDDWYIARMVYQDGGAPTSIFHVPDGNLANLPMLARLLHGAPYVVKKNPEQTLVIGVGGGIDVLLALFNGAKHVVGVEINPVTVDAVTRRYADFAGRVFNRPDVEIVNAEGRHYLTTTDKQFDVIQLTGVDTYSALSLGAYALAENYLYTVEAMQSYWEHLNQDGILSFSRWLFTPARESLRLVAIQLEALRRLGIAEPERHIVVISGKGGGGLWTEILLKKSPFTGAEVEAFHRWANQLHFDVLYDPVQEQINAFSNLIRASESERKAMIEQYPYNLRPTDDDEPFFFQFYRWRSVFHPTDSRGGYLIEQVPLGLTVLLASLVQVFVLSGAFIIGPLLPQRSRLRQIGHKGRILVYFGALGLGFIVVEITLLQKYAVFVGGPIYSMAVTLFAILVFSGLGSLLSQRFKESIHKGLTLIILVLVGMIAAETVFVNYAIPRLMFLSHGTRCVVAVAAVAPLAVVMGMPFPTGLRLAQRLGAAIVPWAWGVNAVTTTLGSILCVLASMEWGFTASLLAAGVIYLVALVTLSPVARAKKLD